LAIIEEFATGWDDLPEQIPGGPEYRVLIKTGRTVPMVSVVGQLAPDGAIELVDILAQQAATELLKASFPMASPSMYRESRAMPCASSPRGRS
jgi:hypothetical protein